MTISTPRPPPLHRRARTIITRKIRKEKIKKQKHYMTDCKNCMWGDKCHTDGECEFYDSLTDSPESLYSKETYQEEWAQYIKHWNSEVTPNYE